MPNYVYPNDGKVHSRFSELKMCTVKSNRGNGQIDRVVALRSGIMEPFYSLDMAFGTERHHDFEAETNRTGKLPECFYELAGTSDVVIDRAEREFALEIAPGLVVHSRPDAYSADLKTIFDYKTVVDGKNGWEANVKKYKYTKQPKFYAMMLKYHGIEIDRGLILCEIWNQERDTIIGYDMVEIEITPEDMEEMRVWAIDRLALLQVALGESKEIEEYWAKAA